MMVKELNVEERLIVAADFKPSEYGRGRGVEKKLIDLVRDLHGTGVCIKVNSVLRFLGYELIDRLHDFGLRVFADLKLIDIPNTMATDGEFLNEIQPDILTVMACAGVNGMKAVQKEVGDHTEVLGVTVLTSFTEEESRDIFTCSTEAGVLRFAEMTQLAGLSGLILSPKEAEIVRSEFGLSLGLNTPGIRPEWSMVDGDDQSRVLTPAKTIQAGADRIVLGRPITSAKNPRDAVKRTLDEISKGLELINKTEE